MQSNTYYGTYNSQPSGQFSQQQQQQQQRPAVPSDWVAAPPVFPRRPPRMPIEVIVPAKKFVPPTVPAENYVYPLPKTTNSEEKIEVDVLESTRASFSLQDKTLVDDTSITDDSNVSVIAAVQNNSNNSNNNTRFIDIRQKKLPPKPTRKEIPIPSRPVSAYYSSSDEEDERDILDDDILRDLTLSRKKSVHDITQSSSSSEEENDEEDNHYKHVPPTHNNDGNVPYIRRVPTPTYSTVPAPVSSNTFRNDNDLPPIPTICAPGCSDDEDDDVMPSIPTICIPGCDDDDYDIPKPKPKKKPVDPVLNAMYCGVRCGFCHDPLSGSAIEVSGEYWHTYCFRCQKCKLNLEHVAYHMGDGLPYCALDFYELFGHRCDYCKTPIEADQWITALGKTYHHGHLFCRECSNPFDVDSGYIEHEGYAYCNKDFDKLFGKPCYSCSELLEGTIVDALGQQWHKQCFVCADCGCIFPDGEFFVVGGKPYCEEHSLKQRKKKTIRNNGLEFTTQDSRRRKDNNQYQFKGIDPIVDSKSNKTNYQFESIDGSISNKNNIESITRSSSSSSSSSSGSGKDSFSSYGRGNGYKNTNTEHNGSVREAPKKSTLMTKRKPLPTMSAPLDDLLPKRTQSPLRQEQYHSSGQQPIPETENAQERICHSCNEFIQDTCSSAFGYDYHFEHFKCFQCNKTLSARVPGGYQKGQDNELICKPCTRKNR